MSRLTLLKDSTAADRAWMAEVAAVFGAREAGLARFDGRAMGEPGSKLRELYAAYEKARAAYEAR
ncbi:MAG: hypothetical protein AB7H66_09065 [Hyphomonadaceae bacterium]